MEKWGSIRISSLYVKYRAANRNAYILKHNLRVTTAGPDGRFLNPKRKTNHVSNGILARKIAEGKSYAKKRNFP